MKLTGIIEDVFRGVTIFRGYATLKTLAKLSSSASYQRNNREGRSDELLHYMDSSQFFFFPELIFGWRIDKAGAIQKLKFEDVSSISVEKGIKIRKAKFKFRELEAGEDPKTKVVTIEIPDMLNEPVFSRIDGNHRLVVIDNIRNAGFDNEYRDICNKVAPYCILLQDNNLEAVKYEVAYFYLINSKALPLTVEENLKSIFSGDYFTNSEKENLAIVEDIGKYESAVKLLVDNEYEFVKEVYNGESYTIALEIIGHLVDIDLNALKRALIQIEALYERDELPGKNKNIVISLIVAYAKHGKEFFDGYIRWLSVNQLVKIENVKPQELLASYEELRKELKIFVAMPYFNGDPDVVRSYNEAYKRCIEKTKQEDSTLHLSLFPIMENDGESRNIDEQIFRQIDQCDIFVADISEKNEGVYLEYGYAKAKRKHRIIMKSENAEVKPHFDLDHDSRVPYKTNDNLLTFEKRFGKQLKSLLNDHYGFTFQID